MTPTTADELNGLKVFSSLRFILSHVRVLIPILYSLLSTPNHPHFSLLLSHIHGVSFCESLFRFWYLQQWASPL
jgi:hypothetical protein